MTNVRDQRNVKRISDEVNKLLLAESNIENAQSAVYKYRYYLAVNNYVYIYDYRQNACIS